MKINYKDITVILVAYHSDFKIEKILRELNPDIKIIIVENSNLSKTKEYFEKNYKNVSVILSNINGGQTGGINIGLKNVKSKYCIYMDMDISFEVNIIDKLYKIAEKIKDIGLLVPPHNKSEYPKEFQYFEKNGEERDTGLKRMLMVHGYLMFLNMSAVREVGFFDENIFFYYDETDYCLRLVKKNYKIYIVKDIKVTHIEGGSYNSETIKKIEPLRQWHYMWGKFYFYKKHFGILKAYIVTFPDLLECLVKIPLLIFFNKNKFLIYFNRLNGLINAMLGKKSWKRL